MNVHELLAAIENSSIGVAVAQIPWLFPTLETVHVLALTSVVGSIWIVDARLIGLGHRKRSISDLMARILPWTWVAFSVALVSGLLLFSSHADHYFDLLPFRLKFFFLALAGLNMAIFHVITQRSLAAWDRAGSPPTAVRLAGAFSMLLWICIVGAGRWIGFV